MQLTFTVPSSQNGQRLNLFLRWQGMSAGRIKSVKYQYNGLLLNGQRARTNQRVATGDIVCVTLEEEQGFSAQPQAIPLEILYETPHAMVLNKPAGLVMHPTCSHKHSTMANAFCGLLQSRGAVAAAFRPVGRLDADTSGLVLCAMNAYAAPLLAQSLQKEYLALVSGRFSAATGSIDAPLGPAPDSLIRQCVSAEGKPSLTRYTVLAAGQTASLVQVQPLTGRTHQIRAHFAHIGHPLLGDTLYGGDTQVIARHALHCAQLVFSQPNAEAPTQINCPLPADFLQAMHALGLGAQG